MGASYGQLIVRMEGDSEEQEIQETVHGLSLLGKMWAIKSPSFISLTCILMPGFVAVCKTLGGSKIWEDFWLEQSFIILCVSPRSTHCPEPVQYPRTPWECAQQEDNTHAAQQGDSTCEGLAGVEGI